METEEAERVFKRYLGMSGIDADKDDPKEVRGHGGEFSIKDLFQITTETVTTNGFSYYPSLDPTHINN